MPIAYGCHPDPPDPRDRVLPAPRGFALPARTLIDWSMFGIYDQYQIGACVFNAEAALARYLAWKRGLAREYSRLFGYNRTRLRMGVPLWSDYGAYIREAVKQWAEEGLCLEALFPYGNGSDNLATPPPPAVCVEAQDHQAFIYVRLPNLDAVRASIAMGWPVLFGMAVPDLLQGDDVARTGEVPWPTDGKMSGSAHCMLAIGYDVAAKVGGTPGVIDAVNSWGKGHGDNGVLHIADRYFTDGLVHDCWGVRYVEG